MMALPVLVLASCQSNDDDEFDNKAAINASSMVDETIVKGSVSSTTKTLELITPRPVEQEVKASFRSAPELLGRYNQAYYASAVLLPDTCYAWQEKDVVINQGSVKSTSATINFEKLGSLSRDKVHFARLEELVLEPFGHAPDNPDHNLRPALLLLVELFEASPYSLFRIVPD